MKKALEKPFPSLPTVKKSESRNSQPYLRLSRFYSSTVFDSLSLSLSTLPCAPCRVRKDSPWLAVRWGNRLRHIDEATLTLCRNKTLTRRLRLMNENVVCLGERRGLVQFCDPLRDPYGISKTQPKNSRLRLLLIFVF